MRIQLFLCRTRQDGHQQAVTMTVLAAMAVHRKTVALATTTTDGMIDVVIDGMVVRCRGNGSGIMDGSRGDSQLLAGRSVGGLPTGASPPIARSVHGSPLRLGSLLAVKGAQTQLPTRRVKARASPSRRIRVTRRRKSNSSSSRRKNAAGVTTITNLTSASLPCSIHIPVLSQHRLAGLAASLAPRRNTLRRQRQANAGIIVRYLLGGLVRQPTRTTLILVVTPAVVRVHLIHPNVVVGTTVQYVAAGAQHILIGCVVGIPAGTGATPVRHHRLGVSTAVDVVGAGTSRPPVTVGVGAGALPKAPKIGPKLFIGYHPRRPSRTFPYPYPSIVTVRTGRGRTRMPMGNCPTYVASSFRGLCVVFRCFQLFPSASLPERPDTSMPPPRNRSPPRRSSPPPTHRSPEQQRKAVAQNSGSSGKKAGFKPIGSANTNSLRRFFPGDDDEDSPPHASKHTGPPSSRADSPELQTTRLNGDTPPQSARRSRQSSVDMEESPRQSYRRNPRDHRSQQPRQPSKPEPPKEKLYVVLGHVGTGTFGKVYKASHTATGRMVALKQIKMEGEKEGFPVTAMREVKLLQSLRHENVLRLYEMMVSHGEFLSAFTFT